MSLNKFLPWLLHSLILVLPAAHAQTAPALDLQVNYYSKLHTAEGVIRESRYSERMLRRPNQVWVERILPAQTLPQETKAGTSKHQHFNAVLFPHRLQAQGNQLKLEFIDAKEKQIISVPAGEYENVHFDGSWENAYHLFNPKQLQSMQRSKREAPSGATWYEREKNGVFQRVLWHEAKQIALLVEQGDKAGSFLNRIEVHIQASLRTDLPWQNLKGYGNKEYADYLD